MKANEAPENNKTRKAPAHDVFAACNGNMRFDKKTKQIEISNVKNK